MTMGIWSSQLEMELSPSNTVTEFAFAFAAQKLGRTSNWTKHLHIPNAPGIASITLTEMIAISITAIYGSTVNPSNVIGRFHKLLCERGG
jgi:hypothetical protein